MAAYTPAAIVGTDLFEAVPVADNFTKLSETLNSTIGDYASGELNIKNGRLALDFASFRRHTLVESFRSADLRSGGGSGDEVFVLLVSGVGATLPWGSWANRYDVAGSGIRFYLRETADVQIASQVNLWKVKPTDAFATNLVAATIEITANLIVDGTTKVTIERDIHMNEGVAGIEDDPRGASVLFNHIEEDMAAGAHTAHIELVLSITQNTGTVNTDHAIMEFKGYGGTTCATAFYK